MAGDWIKMRMDLQTHPKIVRILSATGADKFRVIGGLHAVWSVFDQHSADGVLHGYCPETMDHIIGWTGFSAAMIAVGWMTFDGLETLAMPEFDEHNGTSAKRRADDTKRKRNGRKSGDRPQNVRKMSAYEPDNLETKSGLEKRREENISNTNVLDKQPNTTSSIDGFDMFWSTYPKKVGKDAAMKAWKKLNPDVDVMQQMVFALHWQTGSEQWVRDNGQYIPNPATYLNQGRWNDEPTKINSSPSQRKMPAPDNFDQIAYGSGKL